jgi:hypothetical protein
MENGSIRPGSAFDIFCVPAWIPDTLRSFLAHEEPVILGLVPRICREVE